MAKYRSIVLACIALGMSGAGHAAGQCQPIQTFELRGPLGEHDNVGSHVATDGNILTVVGRFSIGGGGYARTVFVLVPDPDAPSNWIVQAEFDGPIESQSDFGNAISIEGDTILIGDPGDKTKGFDAGAAYVFERDANDPAKWNQTTKLTAPDGSQLHRFGSSVALDGDQAIVGSPGQGYNSTGIAYVFRQDAQNPSDWPFVRTLISKKSGEYDKFGTSMSANAGVLVVGAPNCCKQGETKAHVFRYDGSDWQEEAALLNSGKEFGNAVSIFGDWIIVGSRGSNTAYLYHYDGATWTLEKSLPPPQHLGDDYYGNSLQITDEVAVVGTAYSSLFDYRAGYACVFGRDTGGPDNWGVIDQFIAADTQPTDGFGLQVAAAGRAVVVGVPGHWSGEWGNDVGAAYVFDVACDCPSDCDGNLVLDLFDFLCFINTFAAGGLADDCDGSGSLDFADWLCFINGFNNQCP